MKNILLAVHDALSSTPLRRVLTMGVGLAVLAVFRVELPESDITTVMTAIDGLIMFYLAHTSDKA